MPNINSTLVAMALMALLAFTPSCAQHVGLRVRTWAYPFLVNPQNPDPMIWRLHTGPDFDVFYGQPKNLPAAGIGFYRGWHPNFHPKQEAVRIPGRLGAFDLEWFQTTTTGRVYRAATCEYQTQIIKSANLDRDFRNTEYIHVWAYGPDEKQVEAMTDYLNGMELFREKPKDIILRPWVAGPNDSAEPRRK